MSTFPQTMPLAKNFQQAMSAQHSFQRAIDPRGDLGGSPLQKRPHHELPVGKSIVLILSEDASLVLEWIGMEVLKRCFGMLLHFSCLQRCHKCTGPQSLFSGPIEWTSLIIFIQRPWSIRDLDPNRLLSKESTVNLLIESALLAGLCRSVQP